MWLAITGTWCIAYAKSHHLTYLLHHIYILFPINLILAQPYRTQPETHILLLKETLEAASHEWKIRPCRACKQQMSKTHSAPHSAEIQVGWGTLLFKKRWSGCTIGRCWARRGLWVWHIKVILPSSACVIELSTKDSTLPIQKPNFCHVDD